VLGNYVTENLDTAVSQAFERSITGLSKSGISLTEVRFDGLESLPLMNAKGGIAAAEAYAHHHAQLAEHGERYDPRVGGRISKGGEQSAAEYLELLSWRRSMIAQFADLMRDFDAIVAPTVPVIAPALADFTDDAEYVRLNLLLLRNPSVFNLLDGCAISLPIHQPGDAPVGLMLAAPGGCDRTLLRAALTVETCAMHWPPGNV
jgi:aspartyl-tRNA(Asn)/glutamyl-tRNA(Gln) amidotransferase subunit A